MLMEVVIDARRRPCSRRDHDVHSVTPMFDFGRGRERRCNPVFLGRACLAAAGCTPSNRKPSDFSDRKHRTSVSTANLEADLRKIRGDAAQYGDNDQLMYSVFGKPCHLQLFSERRPKILRIEKLEDRCSLPV